MRQLRKLTKKEWKEISEKYNDGGVVHMMYRGKRTLFYNRNTAKLLYLALDEERKSWQVIIVLPGVEIIPKGTFKNFESVKTVIMADTVKRIEDQAFCWCESLKFVRLSKNLEYIGFEAFSDCDSLTSIFIPESCREICKWAFDGCLQLIILSVPRHTRLGEEVIRNTALIRSSPFDNASPDEINEKIKTISDGQDFILRRECAFMSPSSERIYDIIIALGLQALYRENSIGITPLDYLSANPYTDSDINQQAIAKKYILEMMGEII